MPQDAVSSPSAQGLSDAMNAHSTRPREYYTDQPCSVGAGCGGEGVMLPFDANNADLDEMFGFSDIEELPLSDEVLPVIFDGAFLTEEGLLDCFARHYPERAALLLQLLSPENSSQIGLGYTLEFVEAIELSQDTIAENERITAEFPSMTARRQASEIQATDGPGISPESLRQIERESSAFDNRRIALMRNENELRDNVGNWRIDDGRKTIYIYSIIDVNVDRFPLIEHIASDNGVNPLPTNREGATWLNAVIGDWMARNDVEGASSDEEFLRTFFARSASGAALVALGAVEIFGGVTAAIGSGGIGTVAGVALTVTGFDALTNGVDMLWSPSSASGARGWVGDLVNDTVTEFGNDTLTQQFNQGWAVTQLVAGLGAPVVLRYAARQVTHVAASGANMSAISTGRIDRARLAIVEVIGHRFGPNIIGNYSPLPSGRGAIMNFSGRTMRLPPLDSAIRILLRLQRISRSALWRRFGRRRLHPIPDALTDNASAEALLESAAQHYGLERSALVDEVVYRELGEGRLASFGVTSNGHRYVSFSPRLANENKFMRLRAAAHELNHARFYDRLVQRLGVAETYPEWSRLVRQPVAYAREEVHVERTAQFMIRSVYEGRLSGEDLRSLTHALDQSNAYIARYREIWWRLHRHRLEALGMR